MCIRDRSRRALARRLEQERELPFQPAGSLLAHHCPPQTHQELPASWERRPPAERHRSAAHPDPLDRLLCSPGTKALRRWRPARRPTRSTSSPGASRILHPNAPQQVAPGHAAVAPPLTGALVSPEWPAFERSAPPSALRQQLSARIPDSPMLAASRRHRESAILDPWTSPGESPQPVHPATVPCLWAWLVEMPPAGCAPA